MNKPLEIKTGQKFNSLTVVGFAGRDKNRLKLFFVSCDCGNETFVVYGSHLVSGHTKSCGCVNRRNERHGMCHSTEYNSWSSMLQRCTNPNRKQYSDWGGRGIKVCKRWEKFENFYADMGSKPSRKHSIDRYPDNDGNYEPSNCRWATRKEQNKNTRPFVRFKSRPLAGNSQPDLEKE